MTNDHPIICRGIAHRHSASLASAETMDLMRFRRRSDFLKYFHGLGRCLARMFPAASFRVGLAGGVLSGSKSEPISDSQAPGKSEPKRSRLSGLSASAGAALVLVMTSCDGKISTATAAAATGGSGKFAEVAPGIGYVNERIPKVPWSIHIARVDRTLPEYSIHSVHAQRSALGLGSLSDQVRELPASLGIPVAAVNGDFYQRDRAYAGDPRGMQVVAGELLSSPTGGAVFWTDASGQPHATNVVSLFQSTWPDGTTIPFGLNQERRSDASVLYTPAAGPSTHTSGGREVILVPQGDTAVGPLRSDQEITAVIHEVRDRGDTELKAGQWVLSIGPGLARKLPKVSPGALVRISTTTSIGLKDAGEAMGGGPILVRNGKRQKITNLSGSGGYESSSMYERHPRTAVGWDSRYLYLIQVDGRQEGISVGMTLEELGAYMAQMGCTDAMNLDGGGSATFWFNGKIRNSPCDGRERPIANALVIARKSSTEERKAP